MRIAVGSDESTQLTDAVVEDLRERGHDVSLFGPLEGRSDPWPQLAKTSAPPWPPATPIRACSSAGPAPACPSPPTRCPVSAPPSATMPRPPAVRASGTMPTCWS